MKYRNQPTTVHGRRFASKLEARRYGELRMLQMAHEIDGLECQPRFSLDVNGQHICDYVADFSYIENGALVVEDAKGVLTPDCKIKLALMKAIHGIDVKLIKAPRR